MKVCYEFIGVWGAGKTTLIQIFKKELAAVKSVGEFNDFACFSAADILTLDRRFSAYAIMKLAALCVKLYFINYRLGTYNCFKVILRSAILRGSSSNSVLLWEGEYHLISLLKWNITITDRDLLIPYLMHSKRYQIVPVFVEVSPEVSFSRVKKDFTNGSNKRFLDVNKSEIKGRINSTIKNQDRLKKVFDKNGIFYLTVKNDKENKFPTITSHLVNDFVKRTQ